MGRILGTGTDPLETQLALGLSGPPTPCNLLETIMNAVFTFHFPFCMKSYTHRNIMSCNVYFESVDSSDPDHINTPQKSKLTLPSLSFPQLVMDRV